MSLPPKVQVLIVGAGPIGLVAGITLAKLGVEFAIVDASTRNKSGSRAAIIHAHTLEMLDTIGLAQPMIENGIRCEQVVFNGATNKLLEFNLHQLRDATQFPFSVTIPQDQVEKMLEERLASEGIHIFMNHIAVGLRRNEHGQGVDVMFEDGRVVNTQYVLGADGSRSTIRRLAGIEFTDPYTGIGYDDTTVLPSFHIILADVELADPVPDFVPRNKIAGYLDRFILMIPLPKQQLPEGKIKLFWRVAFLLPASGPQPPKSPSLEFLQQIMDARNPSDSKVTITSVKAATRYKIRAAVASTYFKQIGNGNILLAGDAAHVHSPVGGQGMNLGICDAVAVAHAIRGHIEEEASKYPDLEQRGNPLQRYADTRRKIGVRVVGLTRRLTRLLKANSGWRRIVRNIVMGVISLLPFINKMMVWRISGLINREEN